MRRTLLAVVLVLVFGVVVAAQNPRGPSTAEERARAVTVAHKLESAPLDESLRSDREWALRWLIEVPDVSVKLCTAPLGNFVKSKYKYSSELIAQLTLSSAAFVIEHPDRASDNLGQYTAGVEGVLKAYNAILTTKPDAKSKALDELAQKQAQGTLDEYMREAVQGCK